MKEVIIDVETTGATNGTNGNPFSSVNRLALFGYRTEATNRIFTEAPDQEIDRDIIYIGFNIKFDLHWWARKCSLSLNKIWDCQYAQYCLWRQKVAWISLDDCLKYYGFPLKLDIVKTEYWEKGIDTDQVPEHILREYLEGDLERTEQVYRKQREILEDMPDMLRLVTLGNSDIINTFYMEQAGIPYDNVSSIVAGNEILERIQRIDSGLSTLVGSSSTINWNSNDSISVILFGGVLKEKYRERYSQTLKSGVVKEKERWSIREIPFPALTKPISPEREKPGFYSVNEDVLTKLKNKGKPQVRKICELLLERAKLEKAVSSYYHGLPSLLETMYWTDNILHGQLNHAVTRTGRLASRLPNQQNIPDQIGAFCHSRFTDYSRL